MAPKAKSLRLKVVPGNPGKRKVNNRAPRPDRGVPRRPGWLSPAAKAKFRQLARLLVKLGVLTALDGDALAAYCQALAELREATMALDRDGRTFIDEKGNVRPHPAFAQQQQALRAAGVGGRARPDAGEPPEAGGRAARRRRPARRVPELVEPEREAARDWSQPRS
jgi:P27 family predicted phage terminase small subunit